LHPSLYADLISSRFLISYLSSDKPSSYLRTCDDPSTDVPVREEGRRDSTRKQRVDRRWEDDTESWKQTGRGAEGIREATSDDEHASEPDASETTF